MWPFDSGTDTSSSGGGGGLFGGNFLGSLALGGLSALSNYGTIHSNAQQQASVNALAQQKFNEDKRQFDLNYALAQQKLAQGGGGGGGGGGAAAAALAFAKQKALADAYNNAALTALRGGEGASQGFLNAGQMLIKPLMSAR